MTTNSYQPQAAASRPAAGTRQAIREEIDAIMAKTPPGSREYASKKVQQRMAELTEALAGRGAPVGVGGWHEQGPLQTL
jgi:hypothetical protein